MIFTFLGLITCRSILNSSGKSVTFLSGLDLNGNVFSVFLFSMMLAVCVSCHCYFEECSCIPNFLKVFFFSHGTMLYFINAFSVSRKLHSVYSSVINVLCSIY